MTQEWKVRWVALELEVQWARRYTDQCRPLNNLNVVASEKPSASPAGRVGRAGNRWSEGKVEHKHKQYGGKRQGWGLMPWCDSGWQRQKRSGRDQRGQRRRGAAWSEGHSGTDPLYKIIISWHFVFFYSFVLCWVFFYRVTKDSLVCQETKGGRVRRCCGLFLLVN